MEIKKSRPNIPIGVRCKCYAYLSALELTTIVRWISMKDKNEILMNELVDQEKVMNLDFN